MEIIFKRFPLIRQRVFRYLDNQSLTRIIEAKRGFAEFLKIERFFWIRIIKKYDRNFEGVEDSWKEVLHRTPIDVIKQLALAVEKFFNSYSSEHQVSPLHIVAKKGTLNLFQYVITKVTDKNPKGYLAFMYENMKLIDGIWIWGQHSYSKALTPFHMTAMDGKVELCRFIMDNTDDCNPKSGTDDITPLANL